ncbi:helix-turn-helix domain-containing protein [Actinoallomurus sp. CA-142502]|uniref:helix-turn-helix domain-containing protein n=1 Tax=Actinoallomurus sp. CA-142502 TaxID=3239885 RepID=UPI003D8BEB86
MGIDENAEVEPPRETVDERFADNIRTRREMMGLSQTEVAERMSKEFGHPFHQQTVAKIEKGSRSVRLGEAVALARILDTNVDLLAFPSRAALDARELFIMSRKAGELYKKLVDESKELLTLQADLGSRVGMATRRDYYDGDHKLRVERNLRMARNALELTPDAALARAIEELSAEAIRARDDRDVDREMGVAYPRRTRVPIERLAWLGGELNRMLSSLTHDYRRLWRDPRTFLARHLVMVAALSDGGYSTEEIAELINEDPENVERMISDGKNVYEERHRWEEGEGERSARDKANIEFAYRVGVLPNYEDSRQDALFKWERHLIAVRELHASGMPVETIAEKLGEVPSVVEEMIAEARKLKDSEESDHHSDANAGNREG